MEFSPGELRKFASIFLCINKREEGEGAAREKGGKKLNGDVFWGHN